MIKYLTSSSSALASVKQRKEISSSRLATTEKNILGNELGTLKARGLVKSQESLGSFQVLLKEI